MIIFFIIILPLVSPCFTENNYTVRAYDNSEECYVIENIPYVCQETSFFCGFASPTMILKYYGINTTLHEVLYNSGVGYSLLYSPSFLKRFPVGCTSSSQGTEDRSFLANLYGYTYDRWFVDTTVSKKQQWNDYWNQLKQNIMNNRPILTDVDPVFLPSIRNSIRQTLNISGRLWTRISDHFWNLALTDFYHTIVVVGFNETDGTVCLHDPAAGLFNQPEEGTYIWMDINQFRRALFRLSRRAWIPPAIGVFKESPHPPLEKTTAFALAHERNIEKLKGNLCAYDDFTINKWKCTTVGINGVKAMMEDYKTGIFNRPTTILLYKITNFKRSFYSTYKICKVLEYLLPSAIDLSYAYCLINNFKQIAIEKQYISQYLRLTYSQLEDKKISDICKNDALLFEQEAENWTNLESNFTNFINKGAFIKPRDSFSIIEKMAYSSNNILAIEKQILEGST